MQTNDIYVGSQKAPGAGEKSRKESKATSQAEHPKAEQAKKQIPSMTCLVLAGGSLIGSLALFLAGKRESAIFVGTWVPTLLLLEAYSKAAMASKPEEKPEGTKGSAGIGDIGGAESGIGAAR